MKAVRKCDGGDSEERGARQSRPCHAVVHEPCSTSVTLAPENKWRTLSKRDERRVFFWGRRWAAHERVCMGLAHSEENLNTVSNKSLLPIRYPLASVSLGLPGHLT